MKPNHFYLAVIAVLISISSYSQTNKNQKNMSNQNTKTVLFITGAFVGSNSWDQWKAYFESKGYKCIAPAWPNKDASPAELRGRQPNSAIASMRLTRLVDYYAGIIESMDEKPIVIGHSMGGLVTQLLLQRGLVAYGVAIHSVPTKGVSTFNFKALKAGFKSLGYFTSTSKAYLMSFKTWQFAFTNGMTLSEQKSAYDEFVVPESKFISRDWMTKLAKVDYERPHTPLLFVAGSTDNIIPASFNYSNYKKYTKSNSVTDYKEFADRNHFVLGQSTWKEDADYILSWLDRTINAPVSAKK